MSLFFPSRLKACYASMIDEDYAKLKELAMQWKRAAPFLRAQRHKDIRKQDNARAIELLDSVFTEATRNKRRTTTSGFVKMYEVLKRQKQG